jgi:hypothetical protein
MNLFLDKIALSNVMVNFQSRRTREKDPSALNNMPLTLSCLAFLIANMCFPKQILCVCFNNKSIIHTYFTRVYS